MRYFFVTTPIYYVNDKPHIGHAYSTIIADSVARFKRLSGYRVFFMTGTDEHGLKIEREAAARAVTPRKLADDVHTKFKDLFKLLNISFDRFIRTTDPDHESTVQTAFKKLLEKGDVYLSEYEGWYCVPDETFLTEKSLVEGNCPQCGRAAARVKEKSYFLKLGKYESRLLDYIESHPGFIKPSFRKNEVVSFLKEGLNDLSISRTSFVWGIPVPGDENHVIYVWFDALLNYLTGIGFGDYLKYGNKNGGETFLRFFKTANHVVGKDILKFHSVYWPIMLFALDLPLPETIFAHGWWLMDNKKMSKSLGNVVDPLDLISEYGADALRYYLLREVPPGLDGDFNPDNFITRYNSDLANDLGNLVSRSAAMLAKYMGGEIPGASAGEDNPLLSFADDLAGGLNERYDNYEFSKILEDAFRFVNMVNKYINDNAPWKLNPEEEDGLKTLKKILRTAFVSIYYASYFIYPFMPETSGKINALLNVGPFEFENVKIERGGGLKGFAGGIFNRAHKINMDEKARGVLFPKK